MPCNVQRGEFYIANDGPDSTSEIISNVLPPHGRDSVAVPVHDLGYD